MLLANKITLARAVLILPALLFLNADWHYAALAVFLIASLSDILDGAIARRRGEVTSWGTVVDPVVDKTLYISLLALLTARGEVPLVAMILFVVPPLGLGIGALFLHRQQRQAQGARALGKIAAILAFIAMVFLLLRLPYRDILLYLAIGAAYLASFDYLRIAIRN